MVDLTLAPSDPLTQTRERILLDYRLACRSRQASLVGRREVRSGKAKFGIFGDGKEVIQLAIASVFQKGDFRSGYYRDQTLMLALGEISLRQYFAQLYAHADLEAEPATGGRAMNAHYATRLVNADGTWKDQTEMYNTAADLSPTASQMPRLVGLAYASRLYRELPEMQSATHFSHQGNEIAFGMIGNASCAEGLFWESANAIGVLHVPAIITIYDDGYGISVPNEYAMVKQNMYEALRGFECQEQGCEGYALYSVPGWDYPTLLKVYQAAAANARRAHIPSIIHAYDLTQPLGHSTSGSHERYKSKDRLEFEQEFDCNLKFGQWILESSLATQEELDEIMAEEQAFVEEERKAAWQTFMEPILSERQQAIQLLEKLAADSAFTDQVLQVKNHLAGLPMPNRREIMSALREALTLTRSEGIPTSATNSSRRALVDWKNQFNRDTSTRYDSHLYSQDAASALAIPEIRPAYPTNPPQVYGYEILNACFDAALHREPRLVIFGEDVGRLGDVNQGLRGLQVKYGNLRVSDTGIREATIVGQAIGLALRGLRPIAEIQYLDYLLYALQILSDDLATLHWRTAGGQKAPVILRTRGHRLEGIWHSGSPLAGIIHLLRGIHVLVPRNMTQAAGFYNTLLRSEDPALVIEVLNGYRTREPMPTNIGMVTLAPGVPEILLEGGDITLVTYGACCRIVMDAAAQLRQVGIQAEVIDIQSLLPFDLPGMVLESLKKTGRILFIDEDVPGGATAYMMQAVIENQGGYTWLDSPPRTLAAKAHRPAYGSDGDYWSKPNTDQVFEVVYEIMHEANPKKYPALYS
jgi:pyruvate/2-oxoglutarate/acetoin dehydrogenase E1 component/TPP-dependent pyruvate/acetoin dehydrogenase alpha subunit